MRKALQRLDYIDNWPELAEQSDYDANKLAVRCGICVRQLQRFFHRTRGNSPQSWLNALRLQKARELMEQGGRVKEVAEALKYKQRSHFSRMYRLCYGASPSRLQQQCFVWVSIGCGDKSAADQVAALASYLGCLSGCPCPNPPYAKPPPGSGCSLCPQNGPPVMYGPR